MRLWIRSNRSSRVLVNSSSDREDTPWDSGALRGSGCWALLTVVASVKARLHKTRAEDIISEFSRMESRLGETQLRRASTAQNQSSRNSVKPQ